MISQFIRLEVCVILKIIDEFLVDGTIVASIAVV
jgi:hypothetical protein